MEMSFLSSTVMGVLVRVLKKEKKSIFVFVFWWVLVMGGRKVWFH